MKRLVPTAEMTLGPFFPREFAEGANDLAQGVDAPAIEIVGRVTQANGKALDNVVIEIWQADPHGRFDAPGFVGWGRAATDASGEYRFRTVMPGAPAGRAPHINVCVLYSGLMRQLQTTLFFSRSEDPVLRSVERPERLIVRQEAANRYRFDIRLRGEGETPFFDD